MAKDCPKCRANIAPYIIAMEPASNVFQFCPSCGQPLGFNVRIESGQVKVLPDKGQEV